MRVFIVVLMALLLPLQAAWSAAAMFCQHERNTAWHWGHHQHLPDAACQPAQTLKNNNSPAFINLAAAGKSSFKKDNTPSHAFSLVNHSDHLSGQQPVLDANPQLLVLVPLMQDDTARCPRFNPVLYQSPVLEQPKPPVWPA